MLPSQKEVEDHNITHTPYRRWSKLCVAGSGKEHAHAREGSCEREGLLEYGMDYDHCGGVVNGLEAEDNATTLVPKDRSTGMVWGYVCEPNVSLDKSMIKKQIKNIDVFGRKNIIRKIDGEPCMMAALSEIISARDGQTVLGNPPAFRPKSNGPIENGESKWRWKQSLAIK